MKAKKRISKDRQEEILLEAAKTVVNQEGLSGLTARNVAKQAGYAVGTIYNVFRNMNELILMINGETLMKMKEELKKSLSSMRKNQSLGRILAKFYVGFAKKNTPFWNLLFEFKYPQGETLPQWYKKLVEENFELLENAISRQLSVDPKRLKRASCVIWASFHGIVSLSLTGKLEIGTKERPEHLSESLFENYIKGLTT